MTSRCTDALAAALHQTGFTCFELAHAAVFTGVNSADILSGALRRLASLKALKLAWCGSIRQDAAELLVAALAVLHLTRLDVTSRGVDAESTLAMPEQGLEELQKAQWATVFPASLARQMCSQRQLRQLCADVEWGATLQSFAAMTQLQSLDSGWLPCPSAGTEEMYTRNHIANTRVQPLTALQALTHLKLAPNGYERHTIDRHAIALGCLTNVQHVVLHGIALRPAGA